MTNYERLPLFLAVPQLGVSALGFIVVAWTLRVFIRSIDAQSSAGVARDNSISTGGEKVFEREVQSAIKQSSKDQGKDSRREAQLRNVGAPPRITD